MIEDAAPRVFWTDRPGAPGPWEPLRGHTTADLLIVGWGSTWGAITAAVQRARNEGHKVARVHLTHLNPFPRNLGEVLAKYPRVVVPEMNLGQLARLLRAEYLVDAKSITKIMGQPFTAAELHAHILGAFDD